MLGISYGELFLIVGATAALIGPKDLPIIARTAGRFAGRATGYVHLARGQFESVMQQSQARQVHKELQDTIAQLEAIRHEIRSLSLINPGPLTTRLVDNVVQQPHAVAIEKEHVKPPEENRVKVDATNKDHGPMASTPMDVHSQAIAYDKLAESTAPISNVIGDVLSELKDDSGQFIVLPISAESAKLLPSRREDLSGSDIMLEALLEEDVAHKSKEFFSHAQSQNLRTISDK